MAELDPNLSSAACEMEVQADTGPRSPSLLRDESNLIQRFGRDVEMAGLVNEKKNASLVLLTGISAKRQKPLNASIAASSAAGKNHLMGTVARFIPDEDKKILTGMTPKVLMHAEEDEYQHKAIFIAEYEGVAGADFAIRTMQSEQFIEWEFVENTGNGIQKRRKRVKGPAAIIQATTRVTLHPENETRLLFIQVDESADQTRAINERQALEAEKKIAPTPTDLYERWHEFLKSLKPLPVRISFASQIATHFPGRIQSRRDFPKLLGLIEVLAYLHQHHRETDGEGNIVAGFQDYLGAKDLFEHCYYAGPESKVAELVQAAERVGKEEFTVVELMEKTGWKKTKTYEVLARAEELGNIVPTEVRGKHRLFTKHTEPPLALPSKIRLSADVFRFSAKRGTEVFP
jgi:hypothetical protein